MTDKEKTSFGNLDPKNDRNLLFGVMALRVGLISDAQLVAALHKWVERKTISLAVILIDEGFASAESIQLLEPLVDSFIKQHGGRIDESLATSSTTIELQDNRALGDKVPRKSVDENTKAASGSESNDLPTVRVEERFRVLSFHEEGGLGKVSIALDTEVGRNVAFKEIRDAFADDPVYRERFLLEAEITGRLEHPGIVPVYGLGHLENGRPYYAMRFIKGDSLKSAIKDLHADTSNPFVTKRATFRKLVERFLAVCDSVQYAHDSGVIHRDLKPSNIMLGDYGETLVLDWGLAKTIKETRNNSSETSSIENTWLQPRHGSSVLSSLGLIVGSPAFMSPEQAKGEPDSLGMPTDVFGLGATLYYLLSGQPPYGSGDPSEILEKAKTGVFPQLREVKPEVPGTLADICEKSMAPIIEDRYQSARDLREAIWQWLADEPLSAILATVQHFDRLHQLNPTTVQFRLRLANELTNLSKIYQSLQRLPEALKASERSVSLMEERFLEENMEITEFQELYAARTQLSSVLRMLDDTEKAELLSGLNRDDFIRFLRLAAKDSEHYEELLKLSLHQGFTREEADALLKRHLDEIMSKDSDDSSKLTWGPSDDGSPRFEEPDAYTSVGWTIMPDAGWEGPAPNWKMAGDRYQLLDVLGQGGAAVVYRALDKVFHREVAIKVSRPVNSHVDSMLITEGVVVSLLEHPHILPAYDAGFLAEERDAYLVLRLIEGTDLGKQVAESGSIFSSATSRSSQLLRAFADICDAVEFAHNRGFVHGDPKLSNILIDDTGYAWLTDWGLAHIVDEGAFLKSLGSRKSEVPSSIFKAMSSMSGAGRIIGTPLFMAPETAAGEGVSPKSDVFVLGASLFFLATGASHIMQRTANYSLTEILSWIQQGEFRHARDVNRLVPRKLSILLDKVLVADPQQRLSSAGELADEIRAISQ